MIISTGDDPYAYWDDWPEASEPAISVRHGDGPKLIGKLHMPDGATHHVYEKLPTVGFARVLEER